MGIKLQCSTDGRKAIVILSFKTLRVQENGIPVNVVFTTGLRTVGDVTCRYRQMCLSIFEHTKIPAAFNFNQYICSSKMAAENLKIMSTA